MTTSDDMLVSCLTAFLAGTVTEWTCAQWVVAVSGRQAVLSGFYSMLWAGLLLVGITEALPGALPAVSWVVGYGVGSYAAVKHPTSKERA